MLSVLWVLLRGVCRSGCIGSGWPGLRLSGFWFGCSLLLPGLRIVAPGSSRGGLPCCFGGVLGRWGSIR